MVSNSKLLNPLKKMVCQLKNTRLIPDKIGNMLKNTTGEFLLFI